MFPEDYAMFARRLTLIIAVATLVAGPRQTFADPLPGTKPLAMDRPLDEVMVEGIDRFALRALADSVNHREQHWHRDYTSREAFEKSIASNRAHFARIIGVVD